MILLSMQEYQNKPTFMGSDLSEFMKGGRPSDSVAEVCSILTRIVEHPFENSRYLDTGIFRGNPDHKNNANSENINNY